MVLINKAINEVTVKLVYYGPGLCGKTTNLEKIYGNPKLENKGKMISMSTETDRTLFFDFMPMELGTIAGQKVRVQLYTVPGQVFYDATRKLVLRGSDGVVFVADSQKSMHASNIQSLENLRTNLRLNRIDPDRIAVIFQYNKRDLPNVDTVEEMNAYLHPGASPVVEASAISGVGVTQTLRAAVVRILDNLKNGVDPTLAKEPELDAPDMSARSGVTPASAGTPKFTVPSPSHLSGVQEGVHAVVGDDTIRHVAPPPLEPRLFEAAFGQSAEQSSPPPADSSDEEPALMITPFDSDAADGSLDQIEEMLVGARRLIVSLEGALELAHEQERLLAARLESESARSMTGLATD